VTLTVTVGWVVALATTGMKPESIPAPAPEVAFGGMSVQGLAKVDWVTLWFLGWKVKVMVSPMAAVMDGGSKVKAEVPLANAPTDTPVLAARTNDQRASKAKRRALVKCMASESDKAVRV